MYHIQQSFLSLLGGLVGVVGSGIRSHLPTSWALVQIQVGHPYVDWVFSPYLTAMEYFVVFSSLLKKLNLSYLASTFIKFAFMRALGFATRLNEMKLNIIIK